MDISKYEVTIKRHAFIQAMKRGITPDMIEATIRSGKVQKFGKSNVKITKKYKSGSVVCVDEIIGNKIKFVTIEWRD